MAMMIGDGKSIRSSSPMPRYGKWVSSGPGLRLPLIRSFIGEAARNT
ncbi:hypothetical protein [Agrobacterium tumefaciens]|nr:hypothetical protein [Agrobacterium tumefaciens]